MKKLQKFQDKSYATAYVSEPSISTQETFKQYGSASLSDSQLLGLIIGEKSSHMNSTQVARAIIHHFGGLAEIIKRDWQEFTQFPGVGESTAIKIANSFELFKRLQTISCSTNGQVAIACPEDGVAYFGPKLKYLTKEVFCVGFLNNAKILKGYKMISSGGSTATIVDPAEVMRQAIINEANSILLVHNHPSGSRKESRADIQLTKRLVKSGKMIGIPVDDHLIIAGDEFTSFKSKGLL